MNADSPPKVARGRCEAGERRLVELHGAGERRPVEPSVGRHYTVEAGVDQHGAGEIEADARPEMRARRTSRALIPVPVITQMLSGDPAGTAEAPRTPKCHRSGQSLG